MLEGYYEIYEVYCGERKIASFQKIGNVREYIEANSDLDCITNLKVNGKYAPTRPETGMHFYHEYVPITADNAKGYFITSKGHNSMIVNYVKFDD